MSLLPKKSVNPSPNLRSLTASSGDTRRKKHGKRSSKTPSSKYTGSSGDTRRKKHGLQFSNTSTWSSKNHTGSSASATNAIRIATLRNELDAIERLRTECKDVECVWCSITADWRIRLRRCGHVVCVKCGLDWLQTCIVKMPKVRIACRMIGCKRRIHPNDIDALFDISNRQLDIYMPVETRQRLQKKYDHMLVEYALGTRSTSVKCPSCNMPYSKEPGCYYVQCAFQSCGTWFCFRCGEPVDSMGHYGLGNRCSLGMTDLYRSSYLFRMFFETNIFGIILLSPAIIYASLVLLPIAVFVFFTYKALFELTAKFNQPASTIIKLLLFVPVTFVGLLISMLSTFAGFTLVILYVLFLIFRFMPVFMTVNAIRKMLPRIATLFGVDSLDNLLGDVQEAKVLLEIEAHQKEQEKSEVIQEEAMSKSQALEARVQQEVHNIRYARSMGLDKLKDGVINVSGAVEKANQNIDAVKEGRLKDVTMAGLANVKFSGSGLIKKTIKFSPS